MDQTVKRPNHRPPKERHIDPEDYENEKDLLSIYQVADLLGFHWQTIRKMIREEEIPAFKIRNEWRIRKKDLEIYTGEK